MTRRNPQAQARHGGYMAAARELRRLKIDQTRAIDIFRVIVNANIWLLFQPMDNLLGAYLPQGSGGILINTQRPRSVQRLTAAHEYGHYVHKHTGSFDDESEIGDPFSVRKAEEATAQAFAMDFLMPVQLVNALIEALGISGQIEAYHAYLLSLYMGTSYQATVHQLIAQERITQQYGAALLSITPKEIKRGIGRGLGPSNPWAEIWPLDEGSAGRRFTVGIDDEIRLCLPECPSTGYIWVVETGGLPDLRDKPDALARETMAAARSGRADPDGDAMVDGDLYAAEPDQPLALIRSEFDPIDQRLLTDGIGARGSRYITFRALKRGVCELQLTLRRPWQKQSAPLRAFYADIAVQGKPTGQAERGYFDEEKAATFTLQGRGA